MYPNLVGGVLALSSDQLNNVNGYSNLYWGWGAEDDDMSLRYVIYFLIKVSCVDLLFRHHGDALNREVPANCLLVSVYIFIFIFYLLCHLRIHLKIIKIKRSPTPCYFSWARPSLKIVKHPQPIICTHLRVQCAPIVQRVPLMNNIASLLL